MELPEPCCISEEIERNELERELKALGYDLDALERDNPYNSWMYEDEDL